MIDRRLVMLIEKCGYVSQHGKRVYGTAALLHFLHRPIQSINLRDVERGKQYVKKYFGTYPQGRLLQAASLFLSYLNFSSVESFSFI